MKCFVENIIKIYKYFRMKYFYLGYCFGKSESKPTAPECC